MLLSAHEIVPSIISLEEIGTRQTSDLRTASIHAKVSVALRKKIASSFSKIAVSREDREAVRELLGSFRHMIHNTALLYALGLDIEDFASQQAFRRFRVLSEPSQLVRAFNKLKTPEGASFIDVVFEGTGVSANQRDSLLRKMIDRSTQVTYSIEWVVSNIVKQRVSQGGMLYEQAQYIGGIPLGEYVIEKVLDSLIGRTEDVDSEEEFLSRSSLKKGPKSGTLFYKIFREATKRKKKIEALDENDAKIGKGHFSWKSRSRFISDQVGRVNFAMLDIVTGAVKKDKAANMGDQQAYDAVLENVSEAYSDLVEVVNKERTQSDTEEVRQTLSTARATYKAGGSSDEEKSDYAHSILDLVTTTQVTKEDLRFLLNNLSLISDEASNQKKLREIIYDKLFRRGQLEQRELVFLDGGYDEATLKKESRRLTKRISAEVNAPVSDEDEFIQGELRLEQVETALDEIRVKFRNFPSEIYSLRDAYHYISHKPLIRVFEKAIADVLVDFDLSGDIEEGSGEDMIKDFSDDLLQKVEELKRGKDGKTLLPVGETSGHPLSRYSVADYTPVQGSKSVDAVSAIAGMSSKAISGFTARDFNVASAIQRNLTVEAKRAVDDSTSELKGLVRVQQAISSLATKGPKNEDDVNYAQDVLSQARFVNEELLEKAYSILDSFDKKSTTAKKEAKDFLNIVSESVDEQKEALRLTYKESLGGTVNSLLREAEKEHVGDPSRRFGDTYFKHTAIADRTGRQVLKALGWDTFSANVVRGFKKATDPTNSKTLTSIREEIIKHSGSADVFDEICKKKGFEVTVDANGKVTPGENGKGKKLTNRNAKSIMTEASKELRTSNTYFDVAISKSEEKIEEEVSTGNKEIREALSGNADAMRAFDRFSRNMANGFVQKATEAQSELTDILGGDKKYDGLKKLITELRSAYIQSTIVTFEDRVKKEIKEEHEANLKSIAKELEAKMETLEGQDTDESREELDDLESGIHEIQRKRGRAKKKYQDDVRDALRVARREREVSKKYRYAPAVEAEEEAIRESYDNVVEAGISAIVSLEATGVGEFFGENSNILTNVKDLSIANRANAVRKINALRNKYPSESRTFFPLYNNTGEAQVDRIIELIQKDPSSFPSVSQDELEKGLLFAFLKSPYPDADSVVLVDSEGKGYPYPKPNVFSDVGFATHLQSFFRNLTASVRFDYNTTDTDTKDFLKEFRSTPQGLAIARANEEKSLVLTRALGKGMNYLASNLDALVESIEKGSTWEGLFNNSTAAITFGPYKKTLNNFKGLLADLNLLMFLTSDAVDEGDALQVGINPNTVESLAEIYKMSEEQIEAMVRADFEKEVEDL